MIPPLIKESLDSYASIGKPTGGFLYAVLCNDLRNAVGRADTHSQAALPEIVIYCHNELPGECWGSPQAVDAWISSKRP